MLKYTKDCWQVQVEEASYTKYGGFDGVQEARRQQLDAQAATRMKRKAAEAKKVQNNIQPEHESFVAGRGQKVWVMLFFCCCCQLLA